jgi:hypothetical protein
VFELVQNVGKEPLMAKTSCRGFLQKTLAHHQQLHQFASTGTKVCPFLYVAPPVERFARCTLVDVLGP